MRQPGRGRRRERGVTMMEALVAFTVMALLATTLVMSLRIGINTMDRTSARLLANRRVVGAQGILDAQLRSLFVSDVQCLGGPLGNGSTALFFQGDPQSMRFTTGYSIQEAWRGPAQMVELQVIPGEKEGVRLIANEMPFSGPRSLGRTCAGVSFAAGMGGRPEWLPIAASTSSFVLADLLAAARFLYLDAPPFPEPARWVPRWTKPGLPQAIRVELEPLRRDPTQLPLLSVTAPVRVSRDPLLNYWDE